MVDLLRPVDRWPAEELFQTLVERGGVRVERIVSTGQVSPEGGCYDQAWDEWVVLLSGEAVIEFMDGAGRVVLRPGQAVFIPAHCRHRVAWTPPDVQSIWLAVHFPASASAE
ncbi:MAG: cupin domain-containing protein [Planctomycetota bacterium]|nr:MAG: cupin domain-containing protein [Planctomycetota bacterium]